MPLIQRLQSNQNHPNEGRRSHARHTIGRRVWDRGRKRWIAAFSPLPCRSRCWIEMSSRPSWEERGHPRGPGCGSTAVPAHCPLSQCACVTKALNWRGWAESDAVTKLHIEQNRPILQSFMLVSVKSSTVDSARISNPSCQSHRHLWRWLHSPAFLICHEFCAPFGVVCVNYVYQIKVQPLMEENNIYVL